MDQNTVKQLIASGSSALTSFAQAAKTTGEHLYWILVRQQVIDGIVSTVTWFLFLGITGVIFYKFEKRMYAWKVKEKDNYNDAPIIWIWVGGISIVALSIWFFLSFQQSLEQILNPEYFAIKFIFDNVKK